jgi:glycosyltransferase involved in cell wall biosynthesis
MRVAMIGPFGMRPKGTMAVRALPMAKALARHGHVVAMFLPPWSFPADSGRTWEEDGVRVENVPISPRSMIAPRLVRRTLEWHPDVIHCFKPKSYAGLSGWLLWQMRRAGGAQARLVVDEDDWEGAGGWNELESYSAIQKRFFAWQEHWGLRHCDAITVASRVLETIVWSLGRSPLQVHYLPYGVTQFATSDHEGGRMVRAEHGLGDDLVVLLYTRFFEFQVERLLRVLARLVQLVPKTRLLIVGKGLFGEEGKLLALGREQGLEKQLVYAGWVEEKMLPAYFGAADVAIYPFDDTLVNRCKCVIKLGDLLTAGVPVVAEAVGQNKEYIAHNETGILVPPGGVEEFACATASLLREAGLRDRLGSNAAAVMARDYNWDRLVEVAERAYHSAPPSDS